MPGRAIDEADFGNPLDKCVALASDRAINDAANSFAKNAARRSLS